jgi:hypothetical protein
MRRVPRASLDLLFAIVGFVALGATASAALDPAEWKYRQTVALDHIGITKLALPPSTLNAAQPNLEDLRLLDPAGQEVAFAREDAAAMARPTSLKPEAFTASLTDAGTQLVITTRSTAVVQAVVLATPSPSFLKAARVETSTDGGPWIPRQSGAPLFRQFGAEQLTIELPHERAPAIRITIDDRRTPPIPFTGATLLLDGGSEPAATSALPEARIERREEFADETVLTIDLGAQHVPLASVQVISSDPVFTRRVRIAVPELQDEALTERTVATGPIYRLIDEGLPRQEQLQIPLALTAPGRELRLHIDNGDSPPLGIDAVVVRQRPVWIVFSSPAAGNYTVLTGNPDAAKPRYDVAEFAAALRATAPAAVAIGPPKQNDQYRRRSVVPAAPLAGGPIEVAPWHFHKPVIVSAGGVQQLELDIDVLAHAADGGIDLRLVRDGLQIPYLIERPPLARTLPITMTSGTDPQRPHVSRWTLKLPRAGIPVQRFKVVPSLPLFQRRLRLYEIVDDPASGRRERTLAEVDWIKRPGENRPLDIPVPLPPTTDALFLETDNADNPPLSLSRVDAEYPVVRLVFQADPGPLALYYGNPAVGAPRYDIALIANQLTAAEKNVAKLGEESAPVRSAWTNWREQRAGALFWGALALVVVALLAVIGKLLPKPPPGA